MSSRLEPWTFFYEAQARHKHDNIWIKNLNTSPTLVLVTYQTATSIQQMVCWHVPSSHMIDMTVNTSKISTIIIIP